MTTSAVRVPWHKPLRPVTDHMGMLDGDLHAYIAELRFLNRSRETIRVRTLQVRGWLAWLAAQGSQPTTATRDDVVTFLGGFAEPETRASYRAAVRGYQHWLQQTGRRLDNPAAALPPVHRIPGQPHPIPDPLVAAALDRCGPRVRAMILLGRFAGLRAAEIASVHRDNLVGPTGSEVLVVTGKGARTRRVPAHPLIIPIVEAAPGWLFESASRPGRHLLARSVGDLIADALPGEWAAHSLRHAFACEAYARTHDLRLVQQLLGHADPQTTCIYVGVDLDFSAVRGLHLDAAS